MKRRGMGRAQVAVARIILVSAYWMLNATSPPRPRSDWPQRRNNEAQAGRLIAHLERLGHAVIRPSRLDTGLY
jgi:hypothetical protein